MTRTITRALRERLVEIVREGRVLSCQQDRLFQRFLRTTLVENDHRTVQVVSDAFFNGRGLSSTIVRDLLHDLGIEVKK